MPHHLFEVHGVELEYMIVDRATLRPAPICDRLLMAAADLAGAEATQEDGADAPGEIALGDITWSNELAAHVVEFKTTAPAPSLDDLPARFHRHVRTAEGLLAPMGATLLPTAMHPTMDPARDASLWPHGYSEVYAAFNRIFDCRGHGWTNLQSVHLNLPFHGDDEFGRLHAALRALLPVMPALAASSPLAEGAAPGTLDTRMEVYRTNSRTIPSVAGRVVPEPVFTEADYQTRVLERIYADLAPHDQDGVLRHEWANARGCIARFERGSIEVRVLDIQECPLADLAVCAAVTAAARALSTGALGSQPALRALDTERLESIMLDVIRDGEQARIADAAYLRALGFGDAPTTGAGLWRSLIDRTLAREPSHAQWKSALDTILTRGTLARRILRALQGTPTPDSIHRVYSELSRCLAGNRLFDAGPA